MRRNTWTVGIILMASAMAFLHSCGGDSPTDTGTPPAIIEDPSFSSDIQAIFTNNCISSGCHNAGAAGGMVLLQGQAYANLVNVASTQEIGKTRVIPNDATNSYIVIKLEGRQTSGSRMPLGSTLHANHIQNIKNWINKGAKNN